MASRVETSVPRLGKQCGPLQAALISPPWCIQYSTNVTPLEYKHTSFSQGSVGKYQRRHNSFFSHLFFWSQLGNLDLQILLLQQSPPFLPPPVSPLTSPSKTGITGLVLLLSACGPMGMWSTTHEVGTALREKKGCCWPFEADLCLSAFLCWIISNCHKF